jgi:hypothetical protein
MPALFERQADHDGAEKKPTRELLIVSTLQQS